MRPSSSPSTLDKKRNEMKRKHIEFLKKTFVLIRTKINETENSSGHCDGDEGTI